MILFREKAKAFSLNIRSYSFGPRVLARRHRRIPLAVAQNKRWQHDKVRSGIFGCEPTSPILLTHYILNN